MLLRSCQLVRSIDFQYYLRRNGGQFGEIKWALAMHGVVGEAKHVEQVRSIVLGAICHLPHYPASDGAKTEKYRRRQ